MDTDGMHAWNLNVDDPDKLREEISSYIDSGNLDNDSKLKISLKVDGATSWTEETSARWREALIFIITSVRPKPLEVTFKVINGEANHQFVNETFVDEMYTHAYFVWMKDSSDVLLELQTTPTTMDIIMTEEKDKWIYITRHDEIVIIKCYQPRDCLIIQKKHIEDQQNTITKLLLVRLNELAADPEQQKLRDTFKHLIVLFEPWELSIIKEKRVEGDFSGVQVGSDAIAGHTVKMDRDDTVVISRHSCDPRHVGRHKSCKKCVDICCLPCQYFAGLCLFFGPCCCCFICCLPCCSLCMEDCSCPCICPRDEDED